MKALKYIACVAALAVCGSASAGSFTFNFSGMTSGTGTSVPVDATAVFTTGGGMLTIQLTNNLTNQFTMGQTITDLIFTLSGSSGALSLTQPTGSFVNIDSHGNVSPASGPATHWAVSGTSTFLLTTIGTIGGPPIDGVIGGLQNPNGSLKNGTFDPFIQGTATFTLTNANITAATQVSGVVFSFGTNEGEGSGTGTCTSGCGENAPDGGTTSLLLGFALTGLGVMRRYLKF
jgi:hypothetical protein